METPKELVDAVSRILPRAILVLDTNVIMKRPWLDSYEINMTGPFLLIVLRLVDGELMRLRKDEGKDHATRAKASRACAITGNLYNQGSPATGIDLGNNKWLITVNVPSDSNTNTLEDWQARKDKGTVDAALLRMLAACTQDFPSVSTLLVTEEHDLRRLASTNGLSACKLSELRSPKTFEKIPRETSSSRPHDVDEAVAALLDPKRKRLVEIAITLEELRSEADDLVARGSGRVTYEGNRFPFRWTFPYRNLAIYNLSEDDVPISTESAVMPLENVDFMGADDKIPEGVRSYVCSFLEDAYESKDLQSPLTKVRASMMFNTHMGTTRGGAPIGYPLSEKQKQGRKPEDAESYEEHRILHNRHVNSLFDDSAESIGEDYRTAFQLSEAIDSLWSGGVDEEYDEYNWNVELSLMEFLNVALEAWVVGETREAEYTYRPFAWPEDEVEAVVDDEEEQGEDIE